MTGLRAVGKTVAMAGLVRPGCSLRSIADVAICAPVFPAETKASEVSSTCILIPTTMELFGFFRSPAVGFSDISMTSGASTI